MRDRKGSEKLKDVFGIPLQLTGMVREGTEDHGGCSIPGDGPVTMGLYNFGWLAATDREIKVSNGGGNLVVSKGGEKS